MLSIDHSARISQVQASPARCLDVLGAVEQYGDWASLIRSADALPGVPPRVRIRAELMGLGVEMDCELELGADRAVLRRIPDDARDEERYVMTWTVAPAGSGSVVELHVAALLDAPGPASILRGRVQRKLVEDLLSDFALRLATL